jgi:hypothetical protein
MHRGCAVMMMMMMTTATEARHATERLAVLSKVAAKRAGKVASASRRAQMSRGAGTGKSSPRAATAAPNEARDMGVLGWSGVCHRFRSRDDGNQPRMKTRLYRPTTP